MADAELIGNFTYTFYHAIAEFGFCGSIEKDGAKKIRFAFQLSMRYLNPIQDSAAAGGKIPLHQSNVVSHENGEYILKKPWSGEQVCYPDTDAGILL